jgi:hypothetical protein
MRSAQYQPAPERIAQILRESTIVSKAITRHQREAISEGRFMEALQMKALNSGVSGMISGVIQPHQQSNAA